tara:strand:- start:1758 stop:2567 length:810 start_codon:yes stop_codon:yes gene_type:complete
VPAPTSKRLRNHAKVVQVAAWSYILLAFLYPVFTFSSYQVADQGNIAASLQGLVEGAGASHVWWLFFSLIPMLLVFGSIGFYSAVKPYAFKSAGLSLTFSVISAVGFLLGIGRWATLNWGFGEAFVTYQENSDLLTQLYFWSNQFMGFWLGHVMAELFLFMAMGFMAYAMFHSKRFPRWLCLFAGLLFVLGTVSIFRDMNMAANAVHGFLQTLMLVPLFFILLAIGLFKFKGKATEKPIGRYAKRKNKASKNKKGFVGQFKKRKKSKKR